MKKIFVLSAIVLLLIPFSLQAVVVGINDDVHYDYDGYADDFHIEGIVQSAFNVPPKVLDIMVFGDPGTGNWKVSQYCLTWVGPDTWKFTLDFVTDGQIVWCQWIHFGIMFDVNGTYNIIGDLKGWWTRGGTPIMWASSGQGIRGTAETVEDYKQVAVTGFDVYGDWPNKMLKLTNDTNTIIVLNQFDLTVSNEFVELEDMYKTGLGRPGEISPEYPYFVWTEIPGMPIFLNPGEDFEIRLIDYGLSMMPGQYLQMRLEQFMDGTKDVTIPMKRDIGRTQTGSDWAWGWHQHGE